MKGLKSVALVLMATCLPAMVGSQAEGKSSKSIDWEKKLGKGYYELSIGDVDKAITMFAEKVKAHPESGACHTALGVALKKKGRLQDAKNEFLAATQSDPSFANGFYELGSMQEGDKEFAPAAQSFERFEQLSTDTAKKKVVEDRIRFCKERM